MLDLQRILKDITSSTSERLRLSIPESLGGTMSKAFLPGLLRKVRLSTPKDRSEPVPIYSDLQRNFARLFLSLKSYREEDSDDNKNAAIFDTSLFSRTVFQSALCKCHMAANSRDTECTSSAYLIGVPLARLCGISILRSWEIGISQTIPRDQHLTNDGGHS